MNTIFLSSGPLECVLDYSAEENLLIVKRSFAADQSDHSLRLEVESWDLIKLKCKPQAIAILCGRNGALALGDRLVYIEQKYPLGDVLISDHISGFIVVTELSLVRIDETGRELGSAGLSDVVSDAQCEQDGVHVTLFYGEKEVIPYSALGA